MSISRRSLRKGLVLVGCVVGTVAWPWAGAGGLLLFAGGVLHLLTKATLQQNQILTTAGPYRWTRNPFYLANAMIDGGILCVIGQPWLAAVYVPVWGLAYSRTIQEEEAHLARTFGAAFEDYRRWVPRLVPHRRPWPRSRVQGQLSFRNKNLAEGREYARLVGIALGPAAVWAAECLRQDGAELLRPDRWLELGLIAALPALWVVKLALAETFRRPESRLLPGEVGDLWRALGLIAVTLPLGVSLVAGTGGTSRSPGVLVGMTLFLFLIAWRSRNSLRPWAALGLDLLAAGLLVAAGASVQGLWLAVVPILFLVLDRLDVWGVTRAAVRSESGPPSTRWRYGAPVLAGAAAGFLGMGLLRSGWLL